MNLKISSFVFALPLLCLFGPAPVDAGPAAGANEIGPLSASPNLAVRAAASPLPAVEDGPIVITVGVTNQGPTTAFAVAVNHRLPPGVTFVRSDPAGVVTGGQEGEEVVIAMGNLPAGAAAAAILTARINDVAFGDAETTNRVVNEIQTEGTCWCGPTVWQGQTAMRISVSSWATTDADVERSLEAMVRIARKHQRG